MMRLKHVLILLCLLVPLNVAPLNVAFADSALPLSEEALIRYAQQNPHLIEIQQNQQQAAQTQLNQAGRWADPRLEITQERTSRSAGNQQETSVWLKQDLKPWGMSGIEKQLAQEQNQIQTFGLNLAQQNWTLGLRRLFYQAHLAEQHHQVLAHYHQQLSAMALRVEQRWQLGDASKLDLLRMQTELGAIEAEKLAFYGALQAYKQSLSSLLDRPVVSIDAQLLPDAHNLETFDIEQNLNLQLMTTQTNLNLAHQQAAAKQLYWPDFRLGVGYSQISEAREKVEGFKLGLEMSLPLFSRKQEALILAQTQVINAQAERQLQQQTLQAELSQHLASLHQQQAQAQIWQSLIKQQNQPMVTMAQASYQAGELSMIELLDVYRAQLTHHKNYLNSAFKAREHYIHLQYLLGD
ncbi:TolC family protein [Thiomicrospira sp. R3]|uniref:TolC family protein n=1 Tax=Thiomicrospira sp. R3 TaxID=3035472 RepID=UPI00259BAFAB|nr:TolC family protein [Thiomicrospira sp. R3]WFE67715.1 TolC family protein [Thiomicrospira sp. R3]